MRLNAVQRRWLAIGALFWLLAAATAWGQDEPEVGVSLLADKSAAVPGGTVELAVRLDIESEWHIYWRNRGEGGMEPSFEWALPAGFEVGALQWPAPKRYVDQAGAHTFILEQRPTLLTTLHVPADAEPGKAVEIACTVTYFACKDMCYRGQKSAALELPVVADEGQAEPANEIEFRIARSALPKSAGQAEQLQSLAAVADVDKVRPGDAFKVAVVIEVGSGMHLNSHRPLSPHLAPTDVFPYRVEGLDFGRPTFPQGQVKSFGDQKLSVYSGQVVLVLPVEAQGSLIDAQGEQVEIGGVVTYSACDDETGVCYRPTSARWSLTLPVAAEGVAVARVNEEIFAAAGPGEEAGSTDAVPADGGQVADSREPAAGDEIDMEDNPGVVRGKGFTPDSPLDVQVQEDEHSLAVWLFLAFVAGLILNITPCVLPVIAIKVLSFVQQASESPGRVLKLGLAFSLGMLIVFNALAVLATVLGLVWGQHFQDPVFVVVMAAVVFAFGLSVFGVFTLGVPQTVGALAGKAEGEGYAATIGKGMLATVMGTPCLGPYLGAVMVWAAAQPVWLTFIMFNTIGVGMAFPYILLTANPKWLRFIPKPGPWLVTFKQGMAFLLMATVVYLLAILNGQLGGAAVVWTLVFLLGVGIACWVFGTWWTINASLETRWVAVMVALVILGMSGWFSYGYGVDLKQKKSSAPVQIEPQEVNGQELPWVDFSLARLEELTAQGRTVFLDITADWCPNCKYNLKFVFETEEFADAVKEHDVVPMLADWTAENPEIDKLIAKLRPGGSIPMCVVFPGRRPLSPIVMMGIVTRPQVIDAIEKAVAME